MRIINPLLFWLVAAAVRMQGEAALAARMHRIRAWPGPTAELSALVVVDGLLNLLPGVHDKRAVGCDGFADGAAAQQQEFGWLLAILDHDGTGRQGNEGIGGYALAIDLKIFASEDIECPVYGRCSGGRQG